MSESRVTTANLKGGKSGVLGPRVLKCELTAKRIFESRIFGARALYLTTNELVYSPEGTGRGRPVEGSALDASKEQSLGLFPDCHAEKAYPGRTTLLFPSTCSTVLATMSSLLSLTSGAASFPSVLRPAQSHQHSR